MEGDEDAYLPDEENPISLGAMVPEHNDWSFSFADHDGEETDDEGVSDAEEQGRRYGIDSPRGRKSLAAGALESERHHQYRSHHRASQSVFAAAASSSMMTTSLSSDDDANSDDGEGDTSRLGGVQNVSTALSGANNDEFEVDDWN